MCMVVSEVCSFTLKSPARKQGGLGQATMLGFSSGSIKGRDGLEVPRK